MICLLHHLPQPRRPPLNSSNVTFCAATRLPAVARQPVTQLGALISASSDILDIPYRRLVSASFKFRHLKVHLGSPAKAKKTFCCLIRPRLPLDYTRLLYWNACLEPWLVFARITKRLAQTKLFCQAEALRRLGTLSRDPLVLIIQY